MAREALARALAAEAQVQDTWDEADEDAARMKAAMEGQARAVAHSAWPVPDHLYCLTHTAQFTLPVPAPAPTSAVLGESFLLPAVLRPRWPGVCCVQPCPVIQSCDVPGARAGQVQHSRGHRGSRITRCTSHTVAMATADGRLHMLSIMRIERSNGKHQSSASLWPALQDKPVTPHSEPIPALAWSQDGSQLLACSLDGTASLHEVHHPTPEQALGWQRAAKSGAAGSGAGAGRARRSHSSAGAGPEPGTLSLLRAVSAAGPLVCAAFHPTNPSLFLLVSLGPSWLEPSSPVAQAAGANAGKFSAMLKRKLSKEPTAASAARQAGNGVGGSGSGSSTRATGGYVHVTPHTRIASQVMLVSAATGRIVQALQQPGIATSLHTWQGQRVAVAFAHGTICSYALSTGKAGPTLAAEGALFDAEQLLAAAPRRASLARSANAEHAQLAAAQLRQVMARHAVGERGAAAHAHDLLGAVSALATCARDATPANMGWVVQPAAGASQWTLGVDAQVGVRVASSPLAIAGLQLQKLDSQLGTSVALVRLACGGVWALVHDMARTSAAQRTGGASMALALSPSTKYLRKFMRWDAAPVSALATGADLGSDCFAAGTAAGEVLLLNPHAATVSGAYVGRHVAHSAGISALAWAAHDHVLLSADSQGACVVWDSPA